MKYFRKMRSYFKHVCALLILALLTISCSQSSLNFTEFLYELAEVDVQNRGAHLDSWLKLQEEFPVIDGNDVYFIFKEKKELPIFLTGDMNNWQPKQIPLMKIIGTDYYYTKQNYPSESVFEYIFIVNKRSVLDPLNKKYTKSKKGQSSILFMPDYLYPLEILRRVHQVYSSLDTLTFANHPVYFYKHENSKSNSPIVFFISGKEYLDLAEANIILDNLINDGKIKPCLAVFASSDLNISSLLLFVNKTYNLSENDVIVGSTENIGLSLLKNKYQHIDKIFSQSALAKIDSINFLNELQDADYSDKEIFLTYGHFENRDSIYQSLISFLENKTAKFKYIKYNEGASWISWKGHLDDIFINFLKPDTVE